MPTIKDRLKIYIKSKQISVRQFEINSGVSNGYVSGIQEYIGGDILKKMLIAYPDLNKVWLLTGEGEMLKEPQLNNKYDIRPENYRLRLFREKTGLNQVLFAKKLGIQQGSLSDIERGRTEVSDNIKYRLEKEFNTNIHWLLTGNGEMLKPSEGDMSDMSDMSDMNSNEKINLLLKHFSLNPSDFARRIGLKRAQNIYDIQSGKTGISKAIAKKITDAFPEINIVWLLTGNGEMLKDGEKPQTDGNLIPFYDDIVTVGGVNSGVSQPSEYINAGDWFKEATAALRHYGESMDEYPPGCILALKEVRNKQLVVWGRDYVIETSEYRITKRVQRGKSDEYIRAYSTNAETYSDGRLIHEPVDIAWSDIRSIFLVLGYVVKKNGGTIVFSNKHK